MKVSQLIAELQKMDQDLPIVILDYDSNNGTHYVIANYAEVNPNEDNGGALGVNIGHVIGHTYESLLGGN